MTITLHVARSADEAERLARGEDITLQRTDAEEEAAEAKTAAEAFFEPEALKGKEEDSEGEKVEGNEAKKT